LAGVDGGGGGSGGGGSGGSGGRAACGRAAAVRALRGRGGGDPRGVHGYDHAVLEDEAERGRAMVRLNIRHGVALERVDLRHQASASCTASSDKRET